VFNRVDAFGCSFILLKLLVPRLIKVAITMEFDFLKDSASKLEI